MSKVIYDMSMSLDGFVAAAGITPDEPLGVDGERLHHWAFPGTDDRSRQLLEENGKGIGAMITGRRTYDASLRWWGADGPTGEHRLPVYVLTHRQSPPPPADGVYTFVTDGVDSAVRQAKAAADGKNVGVSGVEVGRQLLQAGHVDELWIHVVPVLFGSGIRLYEQADGRHIDLDLIEGVPTPNAAHLRFRVRS
jgi:dihydrofolate reductase